MFVYLEVDALQKDIKERNYDIADKIANIRKLLLFEESSQIFPNEAKTIAAHIWNSAIKLQRFLSDLNESNDSSLKMMIIPSMKILAAEIYQKFIDQSNEDDEIKLFYILSYTYKSLLDSGNVEYANSYLKLATDLYDQLKSSSKLDLILVQLVIWQAQFEISQNNDFNKALEIIKEFTEHYKIKSTFLISFIYEKSMESQSIDWIKYSLSLINSYSDFPNEWRIQIEYLLANFYINNNEPDNSLKYISNLPNSLNKLYLELRCSLLRSPNNENLKEKLISFISLSNDSQNLLVDLCIFIANHCTKIGQASIEFITKVMNSIQDIKTIDFRKHVYLSSIHISCELDDIEACSLFLSIINNEISEKDKKEIFVVLWNKALDMFDVNEYEMSAKWMKLSSGQISNSDNEGYSSCLRFICRCYIEDKKYQEALSYANNAIQYQPECIHGYLLKFRILVKMEDKNGAYDFIDDILSNSPYIEQFELSFFSSVSSELRSIGNSNLALKTLLKSYELNFNSSRKEDSNNQSEIQSTTQKNIKKSIINSVFSLLLEIDDISYISKSINIISSKWNSQVVYKIIKKEDENSTVSDSLLLSFTSEEIHSYVFVAFQNGVNLKNKGKLKKAIKSFISGSLFSGDLIDCKAPCIFEAIDCYIKLIDISNEDKKLSVLSSDSPLLLAQSLVDEISPIIEKYSNIEKKYKDYLLLSKLKISILMTKIKSSKENFDKVLELMRLIKSDDLLFEMCIFTCNYKAPQEIIFAILETAKEIDKKRNGSSMLSASLLHHFVILSKTLDESRKSYNIVLNFLEKENTSKLLTNSQLKFFMSHAWNIGVQCVKSFRLKDAEWWFTTALNIVKMNDDLKSQYCEELNGKYIQFLVHNKNRIAFLF